MPYAFFQVPAQVPSAASEELNQFLRSHSVIDVEKRFHVDTTQTGMAYWSFCITFEDGKKPASPGSRKPKVDYQEVLTPAQFAVFSRLRDIRRKLSEQEGIPVYAIATNEQLAEMVRNAVQSTSALAQISGFGEAKAERYGPALLVALQESESGASQQLKGDGDDAEKKSDHSA